MEKTITVNAYILKHEKYSNLLNELRNILLSTSLKETVKWGIPTYTYDSKNLVGIGAFKNHVAIWFFQGALIKDKYRVLKNAQEGKTKAMRQIRFKNSDDIDEKIIFEYVSQTIKNQKSGLIIRPKKNTCEILVPKELAVIFDKDSELKNNFDGLTLGRRREYVQHIESAKREATKLSRIEKIIPLIMEKKGLYDKYKNC